MSAEAPGWSSEEAELYLAHPLEIGLTGLPKLASMSSVSGSHYARVTLEFANPDELAYALARPDEFAARQEVLDRLSHVELPSGIQATLGPTSRQRVALRYVVRGPPMQARTFADWTLERAMRTIPGVVDADSRGGEVEELDVMLDPTRLATYGVVASDVQSAIANANLAIGGDVSADGGGYNIRGITGLHGADDIADVTVREPAGMPRIRVKDVATVERGAAPRTCRVLDDRDDVVEGVVFALGGADLQTVRAAAIQKLYEAATQAPPGITLAPLTLERETLVAVPGRTLVEPTAIARAVRAEAAKAGPVVIEACREVQAERSVPDELVVWSQQPVQPLLAGIPEARVVPPDSTSWVRIYGADLAELSRIAGAVAAAVENPASRLAVVERIGTDRSTRLAITPDRHALARYGLNTGDVTSAIELALGGSTITQVTEGTRMISVVMRMRRLADDVTAIRTLSVATPNGPVPLGQLATIQQAESPTEILRKDGSRVVGVRVRVPDAVAAAQLRLRLEQVTVPAMYAVRVDDAW